MCPLWKCLCCCPFVLKLIRACHTNASRLQVTGKAARRYEGFGRRGEGGGGLFFSSSDSEGALLHVITPLCDHPVTQRGPVISSQQTE